MSPLTHLFISWSVANISDLKKRERRYVTLSGVIPDIDGLGIIADLMTRNTEHPLSLWDYHHILGHNIGLCIFLTCMAFFFSSRRQITAMLVFFSFHIHLLCDLIGARGPDGDQWHIPYLLPFSDIWQFAWEGQWQLNAPPNFIITGLFLILTFYLAWKRGISPLEIISEKADNKFVDTLRTRFGQP